MEWSLSFSSCRKVIGNANFGEAKGGLGSKVPSWGSWITNVKLVWSWTIVCKQEIIQQNTAPQTSIWKHIRTNSRHCMSTPATKAFSRVWPRSPYTGKFFMLPKDTFEDLWLHGIIRIWNNIFFIEMPADWLSSDSCLKTDPQPRSEWYKLKIFTCSSWRITRMESYLTLWSSWDSH